MKVYKNYIFLTIQSIDHSDPQSVYTELFIRTLSIWSVFIFCLWRFSFQDCLIEFWDESSRIRNLDESCLNSVTADFYTRFRKSQWFKCFDGFCFNMTNFCVILSFDRLLLETCCSTFWTREVLTACSGLTVKISVCNFQVLTAVRFQTSSIFVLTIFWYQFLYS